MKDLIICALLIAVFFSTAKIINQASALNTFGAYQELSAAHLSLLKKRHEIEIKNNRAGAVWLYKSDNGHCSHGFVGDQTFDIREIDSEGVWVRSGAFIDLGCLDYVGDFDFAK